MKLTIPVFFSCDDNYSPYLAVTLRSLIDSSNPDVDYDIYVLETNMSEKNKEILKRMEKPNIKINYVNITNKLNKIGKKLDDVRDYYTQTIFYRLFIAGLFPKLHKAIYLDCDIVVLDDLVELFNTDLQGNVLGCAIDEIVANNKDFQYYVRDAIDVEPENYFNSGVLVIDLDLFRQMKIEEIFVTMVNEYSFKSVAPDQDFLNYVCRDCHYVIGEEWNRMPIDNGYNGDIRIIHYNMFMKPWHYQDILYSEYFYKYAKNVEYYQAILDDRDCYTDEMKLRDLEGVKRMVLMCEDIIASGHTYKNKFIAYRK